MGVKYNDLTATSLEIIVSKGNHPQMALIQVCEILQFTQIFVTQLYMWGKLTGGTYKSVTSVTAHEPVTKSDGHWSVLVTSCDLLGHELGDIFGTNFHVFGDILMGNYVFETIKTRYSVKKWKLSHNLHGFENMFSVSPIF